MNPMMLVQIIGVPIECKDGVKDSWRQVSAWAAGQLRTRFGDNVQVKYYDLFDADCPPLPTDAQLPLVMVDGEVVPSGGKISVPAIRGRIEATIQRMQESSHG
jgi:hypothetical protein